MPTTPPTGPSDTNWAFSRFSLATDLKLTVYPHADKETGETPSLAEVFVNIACHRVGGGACDRDMGAKVPVVGTTSKRHIRDGLMLDEHIIGHIRSIHGIGSDGADAVVAAELFMSTESDRMTNKLTEHQLTAFKMIAAARTVDGLPFELMAVAVRISVNRLEVPYAVLVHRGTTDGILD